MQVHSAHLRYFCTHLLLVWALACADKQSIIELHGFVTDDEGKPIQGAEVFIGEELVGTSDKGGQFKGRTSLAQKASHVLHVAKTSPDRYYSSFNRTIALQSGTRFETDVRVILHSAPKTPALMLAGDGALKKSDRIAAIPGQAAPIAPSSATQSAAKPEFFMERMSKAYPDDKTLRNVYVRSKSGAPLANANVRTADSEKRFGRPCITNAHGKCRIALKKNPALKNVRALVTHPDFRARALDIEIQKPGPIYVGLDPGHTLNVLTLSLSSTGVRPLAGVGVFLDGNSVGETDGFGLFIQPLHRSTTPAITLRAPSNYPTSISRSVDLINHDLLEQLYSAAACSDPVWEISEPGELYRSEIPTVVKARLDRALALATHSIRRPLCRPMQLQLNLSNTVPWQFELSGRLVFDTSMRLKVIHRILQPFDGAAIELAIADAFAVINRFGPTNLLVEHLEPGKIKLSLGTAQGPFKLGDLVELSEVTFASGRENSRPLGMQVMGSDEHSLSLQTTDQAQLLPERGAMARVQLTPQKPRKM